MTLKLGTQDSQTRLAQAAAREDFEFATLAHFFSVMMGVPEKYFTEFRYTPGEYRPWTITLEV